LAAAPPQKQQQWDSGATVQFWTKVRTWTWTSPNGTQVQSKV
jgi:hypothetical protein